MDYYSVLGIAVSASPEEIKRAYRRLVFRYHPDRNPGNDDASDKFKEILDAYNVLSDADRRAEYDAATRSDGDKASPGGKQQRHQEQKSGDTSGNGSGFGFAQGHKADVEAEPKCPVCSIPGTENILSRRGGSGTARGKQFVTAPFNVIFCKACGHIYGVTPNIS